LVDFFFHAEDGIRVRDVTGVQTCALPILNFSESDIIIPDETIEYIITKPSFTKNEDGVRNLKRCLEIIYTKLNLYRLIKPDTELLTKEINIKVEFPFTVTKKHVDILIKEDDTMNQSLLAMYV